MEHSSPIVFSKKQARKALKNSGNDSLIDAEHVYPDVENVDQLAEILRELANLRSQNRQLSEDIFQLREDF